MERMVTARKGRRRRRHEPLGPPEYLRSFSLAWGGREWAALTAVSRRTASTSTVLMRAVLSRDGQELTPIFEIAYIRFAADWESRL